jgi:DNA helicase-2/ATP-dependent DNA helicase PcrA
MDAEGLLQGLNDAQRRAVESTARPLCILAGAGSGKTRVLTRRIAYRAVQGDLETNHVLAVTFTRKAAGELTHRLRDLGLRDSVAAGTFHGIAYAQLRARWNDRGIRPPSLLERKAGFVARLLPPALSRRGVSALDIVSEIEWAKARMLGPDDYSGAATLAGRRVSTDYTTVAELFARYEKQKRERRMVDFDDLLRLCRRDLVEDREFGAAQRWRFRHFFVDEFQDVNPLQQQLLAAWLHDRADLCVVGDPNQAIYAWNGADPNYLRNFAKHHPGGDTVRLDVNYRSSPQILAVANAVLDHRGEERLVPTRGDGPVPTVRAATDDRTEAALIARAARDLHRPEGRWADQAVLVRTHAQTALIETALHQAGIPFRVRGSSGLLERPEVKTALRTLGTSRTFADALADLGELVNEAGDTERGTNLAALVRLGHDYEAVDPQPTPAGFLAWLSDNTAEQPDAGGDAVEVATFHAAKGLEWPIVHLAGFEQGLVPISYARTRDALDEERRLVYVAITRAQRELRITWAKQRTFGERTVNREPSLYVDDIDRACGRLAEPRRSEPPKRARRDASARTKANDEADGVLRALKQWRADKARAAAVPAYVIFHDRTLEAVAAAKPRTHAQLLALPGVGPVKVNRYGDDLLEVVASSA